MGRSDDLYKLPGELPVPSDDGAANHLNGVQLPSLDLQSTAGRWVDLSKGSARWTVVYCYPRTGLPGQDPPGGLGEWNAIPGARGCTPQSCGYRDHNLELKNEGAEVFGLSTQSSEYQREMVGRLGLPFEVLSDEGLRFARALRLPTFDFAGMTQLKRLTMVIALGRIEKVFYPVFPPDMDAETVLNWLRARKAR